MNSAIEKLLAFRVSDVMRRDVITVLHTDTMGYAATVLDKFGISGVPVVDDDGKCIGVLSATDFVHRELTSTTGKAGALDFSDMHVSRPIDPAESMAGNQVGTYMSPLVQVVGADQPIMNVARTLCEEQIHRVIVVDQQQRPVGILSSLDLIACMVVAVEN